MRLQCTHCCDCSNHIDKAALCLPGVCCRMSAVYVCFSYIPHCGLHSSMLIRSLLLQASLQLPNAALSNPTAALVLDLFQCNFPPDTSLNQLQPRSDVRTSVVAKLGRLRSRGSVEGTPKAVPGSPLKAQVAKSGQVRRSSSSSPSQNSPSDNSPASSSNNSRTSSRASSRGSQQKAVPAAAVESTSTVEQEAVAQSVPSSSDTTRVEMVALGTVSFPLGQLSNDRTGTMTEMQGQLAPVPGVELETAAEQGLLVRLEVQAWSVYALAAQHSETPSWQQDTGAAEHHSMCHVSSFVLAQASPLSCLHGHCHCLVRSLHLESVSCILICIGTSLPSQLCTLSFSCQKLAYRKIVCWQRLFFSKVKILCKASNISSAVSNTSSAVAGARPSCLSNSQKNKAFMPALKAAQHVAVSHICDIVC